LFSRIKKRLPTEKSIDQYPTLKKYKEYLKNPNLWKMTPESVARGAAVGIFAAFLPLPCQMLLAALLSVLLRGNLPIALAFTWISNPLTFLPFNYLIYKVGSLITGEKGDMIFDAGNNIQFDNFRVFWATFRIWFSKLGKSFLIGVPIVSLAMALIGYVLTKGIYNISLQFKKK
jgi:uncharacterized protein (DUF2062 family)